MPAESGLAKALYGQSQVVAMLTQAQNHLAAAYLFDGPEGVGKAYAARLWASELLCRAHPEGASAREALLRRIHEGNHPDLRILRPRDEGAGNLSVEVVRGQVVEVAARAPFESAHCFFILEDVDRALPQRYPEAANALLKTLEEPKPGVHFILTASRPDMLLSTLRSRCRCLRFAALDRGSAARILAEKLEDDVSKDSQDLALTISGGAIAAALTLCQGELLPMLLAETDACFNQLHTHAPQAHIGELAGRIHESGHSVLWLQLLQRLYRDAWRRKLDVEMGGAVVATPPALESLIARLLAYPLATLLDSAQQIESALHELSTSTQARLVMEVLLGELRRSVQSQTSTSR